MTIEDRVARLEQRIDQMDRIELRLEHVEEAIVGLRADFNAYRTDNAQALSRILATLQDLANRPAFRWPWERRP
jgi:hypothetical protein